MNTKDLFITNSIQNRYFKKKFLKKYSENFQHIISKANLEIRSPKKTFNILDKNFKLNFSINDLKKFRKFKTIVLIGMGGSILGAEAIYNFFQAKIKKKVYFLDNLDETKITNIKKNENLSKILFIIISKSGNTIETLSNTFLLDIIKKNSKNIIIITERKNNLLFSLSKKFNLFYVEHKDYIGGRYSVLSEVGLLPGYLMNIDIVKLRSKIQIYSSQKEKLFIKNSTTKIASMLASKKVNNLIFINYVPELEKFLFWCQQLIAESLGKKNNGFLPMVSTAPKDHHSLLQLYLDGPKDKLFNIFSFEKNSKEKINIKKSNGINIFLNKKKLSTVKLAQKQALIKALKRNNIPFREFKIKAINEIVLGKLFSIFITETIIIGKLLNINPFDQPAVEQVKVDTKQLLS